MKLIVGLGNPGDKYEDSRHNLGFDAISALLKQLQPVEQTNWSHDAKLKSERVQIEYNTHSNEKEKVILAKPQTFMNNSGMAVRLISDFYKITPSDIWIVYDELDLPLGALKIRLGGSGAGHRGIESIIDALGTDKFWRFRLGIGVSHNHEEIAGHRIKDASEFVLEKFSRGEAGKVRELIKRSQKAIVCALDTGLESAMNQYNSK